jgi:nucleotide-binding universal stress UspA family protein
MFEKILVPLDGSKASEKALPVAAELAKKFNSHITLIHSCHTEGFGIGEASPQVVESAPIAEKGICESFLSQAGQSLQAQGVNANWVCVEGVPAREVVAYARDHLMDLICLVTHGQGEGYMTNHTADQIVANSKVPVMLIRGREFESPMQFKAPTGYESGVP